MYEQMRNLIDEFKRFVVFKDNFFFVPFFVFVTIPLLVVLPPVDLVLGVFGMLTQFHQKLSPVLQELE